MFTYQKELVKIYRSIKRSGRERLAANKKSDSWRRSEERRMVEDRMTLEMIMGRAERGEAREKSNILEEGRSIGVGR